MGNFDGTIGGTHVMDLATTRRVWGAVGCSLTADIFLEGVGVFPIGTQYNYNGFTVQSSSVLKNLVIIIINIFILFYLLATLSEQVAYMCPLCPQVPWRQSYPSLL